MINYLLKLIYNKLIISKNLSNFMLVKIFKK